MRPFAILALLHLAACAAPRAGAAAEELLERGGDLSLIDADKTGVFVDTTSVTAVGMTEVPGTSRLQAAYALVDAVTRAELAKAVAVAITSLELDITRSDAAPELERSETEATRALLPRLSSMTRGYARVRRGDEVVLRLWARAEVPRAALLEVVTDVLRARGREAGRAEEALSRMSSEVVMPP